MRNSTGWTLKCGYCVEFLVIQAKFHFSFVSSDFCIMISEILSTKQYVRTTYVKCVTVTQPETYASFCANIFLFDANICCILLMSKRQTNTFDEIQIIMHDNISPIWGKIKENIFIYHIWPSFAHIQCSTSIIQYPKDFYGTMTNTQYIIFSSTLFE